MCLCAWFSVLIDDLCAYVVIRGFIPGGKVREDYWYGELCHMTAEVVFVCSVIDAISCSVCYA